MSLGSYVTLEDAIQQYNLDARLLTRSVEDGKIRGGRFNGTLVLLEEDIEHMAKQQATKEQLRAKVAHLEGKPIGVLEASRKYNLNNASICRWIKAGYIRTISSPQGRGHKRLIDESDVAYAKELMNTRQIGQGKRTFASEFIPDWF
jgi:predicted site-specific integrase-resolvase